MSYHSHINIILYHMAIRTLGVLGNPTAGAFATVSNAVSKFSLESDFSAAAASP